jgi:hypothetical protein
MVTDEEEKKPIIEVTLPKEAMPYIVEIPLDDGCIFIMDSPNEEKEGWNLLFPGGFSITCPHGTTFNTDNMKREE